MSENLQIPEVTIKTYKRRWIVLIIYMLCAALSSFQWMEYSIITNIIMKYYNGVRVAMLCGGIGTAFGTILKIFSVQRDLFWLVMVCQGCLSISQSILAGLPTKLAAVWFGSNQVSTACALGIFGNQLGQAISFFLTPILVNNHEDPKQIGHDLYFLTWVLIGFTIPIIISIVVYFPNQPSHPPSQSQLNKQNIDQDKENFFTSFRMLLSNKAFLMHTLACGIDGAGYISIVTFLNQFILYYFKDCEKDVGRIGSLLVVVGMIGSVSIGIILDKTKRYKLTSVIIYSLTFLSTVVYLIALEYRSMLSVYLTMTLFGLFTGAYRNIAFEIAIELSYPGSESIAAGILVSAVQIVGTMLSLMTGLLTAQYGCFYAILSLVILVLIGTVITYLVPNKIARQAALIEKLVLNVKYKTVPNLEEA